MWISDLRAGCTFALTQQQLYHLWQQPVRFALQCNQPIAFGGITLTGLSGKSGANDILATSLDGLGIELQPGAWLKEVYLKE